MSRQQGFTYVELSTVMAIIAILASILYPVFTRAREKGRMTDCQFHLRQMGMAFQVYARDWNGLLPPVKDDLSPLLPYLREPGALLCPTARAEKVKPPHYWYRPGHAFDDLPDLPIVGDMRPWHSGGGNVLFVDGHVKWYLERLFKALKRGMKASEVEAKFRRPPW